MLSLSRTTLLLRQNTLLARQTFSFATTVKAKKLKSYYQILQVPTSAPQSNIKKNYLKLAKIFHPDVYKGSDKNRFEQIKIAYEVLSDKRKRQQYDQKIGLRKRSPDSSTSQQFEGTQAQRAAASEEVNKQNNFTYQQTGEQEAQINLDEEYQKFFKKKKQTDFQEIRLHEQTEFQQMSEKERVRFRFRELYDNDAAQLKFQQTPSYQDLLDDQIKQRNTHYEDMKKRKQNIDAINSQEGIKKQKKLVYFLTFLGALIFYPLMISFLTKYRQEKEQQQRMMEIMEEMERKAQEAQIRSRFQY